MKDIFLDTEPLILYLVGTINEEYLKDIRKHNKISIYSQREFDLVSGLAGAYRIISSPNVWTEVDNHLNENFHGNERYTYFQLMKKLIENSIEKYVESKSTVQEYSLFTEIGVTDSVILELALDCEILVTGDSKLSDFARARGLEVVDLKAIVAARLAEG